MAPQKYNKGLGSAATTWLIAEFCNRGGAGRRCSIEPCGDVRTNVGTHQAVGALPGGQRQEIKVMVGGRVKTPDRQL